MRIQYLIFIYDRDGDDDDDDGSGQSFGGDLWWCTSGIRIRIIRGVRNPGMKRDELRVAFEAWNFCNEVGLQLEAPYSMGISPRTADCFLLISSPSALLTSHHPLSLPTFGTFCRPTTFVSPNIL